MSDPLLGLIVCVGFIGFMWLGTTSILGGHLLLGFMVGVFSHAVLLIGVGIVGFDEYPKIPLIGGVVIGAIVFLITWVDRDKPLDKNTEQYLRSGTGNTKDGIDDGGE